jgi:hypothetical protein
MGVLACRSEGRPDAPVWAAARSARPASPSFEGDRDRGDPPALSALAEGTLCPDHRMCSSSLTIFRRERITVLPRLTPESLAKVCLTIAVSLGRLRFRNSCPGFE